MTGQEWLWLGFAGMAIGSLVLLVQGWRRRTRDEENHYLLHFFVTLTASASYLAMAIGQGAVQLSDGRAFYFARYLDWSVTTPLLLAGLGLTALSTPSRRWALLLGILFADGFMILTGLFAGLSPAGSAAKWAWFLVSSGAFLFIYIGLWGPLRAEATTSGPAAAANYTTNASILSVLWLAYPIIFLLGSEGLNIIDATLTTALYTVFDVLAKVAYGIYSMALTQRRVTAALAAGEVPAYDLRPAPADYREVQEVAPTGRVAKPVR